MDDWKLLLEWLMKALLGGVVTYGVHVLGGVKSSIDTLNIQVAKVIERTEWHSKEIERLDTRMHRVEMREIQIAKPR